LGKKKAHGPTRNTTAAKNLVFFNTSEESEHSDREINYLGELSDAELLQLPLAPKAQEESQNSSLMKK